MKTRTEILESMAAIALLAALVGAAWAGRAEAAVEKPATTKTTKPAKPPAKARSAKPQPAPLPEATPEQLEAAQRVFHGRYDCEFAQAIDVAPHPKYPGYVDVRHGKAVYLMKPVLSTTGALRLEDVKGVTLMVQIASKSMLMDVKAGRRLVDECISAQQRELIIEAAKAKAAEAAASEAARAASAPAAADAASDAASAAAPR